MTIGDRIKTKRELIGMSQTELAEKINSSKQTLYKYENGIITNIPSDKIELLAKYLETTPAYLMGWEDNLTKENAILTVDLWSDTLLLSKIKKLNELSEDNKRTIFDMIDFLHQKERC